MVGISAWAFGISGLPLTVMVVAAALPIGANLLLFAQRYEVAQEATTASMGVSTVVAMFTLSLVMLVMSWM
jgi:predicted permease